MNNFHLFYPVNPHVVNLAWGISNPAEYQQFGFTAHNGIDINLAMGQGIYCPIDGQVINSGNQPNGSGIFVSVISDQPYMFQDGISAYVLIDLMHCQEILVKNGDMVKVGQLLAHGDSTGHSTGSHTHMQLRRENLTQVAPDQTINVYRIKNNNYAFQDVDKNEANNSIDPTPYWNGQYANQFNTDPASLDPVAALEQQLTQLIAKRNALIAQLQKKAAGNS